LVNRFKTGLLMAREPLHDGGLAGLFSTHPPIEERIRRLLALASQCQRGLQPR
jgi:heat shock protein HtpX